MSEYDALLRNVVANPAEDAPRMVMADWLQENGQPLRAELIRVQCEIGQLSVGGLPHYGSRKHARTYVMLLARERELLRDTARDADGVSSWDWDWFLAAPLSGILPLKTARGFVSAVSADPISWCKYAGQILAAHPIEFVTLTAWPSVANYRMAIENPDGSRSVLIAGSWVAARPNVTTSPRDWYAACFVARWPGIEFILPTQGGGEDFSDINDMPRQLQEAMPSN